MKNRNLLISKAYRTIVSTLVNLVAHQTNNNIKNTILIIGSTRSGTTFLMESINQNNDYRLIFEPFNNTYTKEWREFDTREYLDLTQTNDYHKSVINKILTGQISNQWINRYNRKVRSDKRLIKEVRANLLVECIRTQYPELPIIYLVRNPYEVVASRINMNFDANDVELVRNKTAFIEKHYPDIQCNILSKKIETKEGKHAALWCLENRFLLRMHSQLDLKLLKYEEIIGMSVRIEKGEIRLTEKTSKPSASTSPRSAYQLSQSERENITNVLEFFGMKEYVI